MTAFTAVLLYVIIWWVVIFAVLPWGARAPEPEEVEQGHAPSAPRRPLLVRKFLITSAVALIIWGILFYLIDSGVIDFRNF